MPRPDRSDSDEESLNPTEQPLRWYRESTHWAVTLSRDLLTGIAIVLVLATLLFTISGVWPPLVAVESGSMDPHIKQGDLVLVVDTDRYASDIATADGVVPRDIGAEAGHQQFDEPGSVIVFRPDGGYGTPVIHRAELYVEEGEKWVDRADPAYLGGRTTCEAVPDCPAPYDGYVTKGDANAGYDVIQGQTALVKPEWIQGKAAYRIPYLGCLRLAFEPGESCREDSPETGRLTVEDG